MFVRHDSYTMMRLAKSDCHNRRSREAKERSISRARMLERMVDTVLYFEDKHRSFRVLRS